MKNYKKYFFIGLIFSLLACNSDGLINEIDNKKIFIYNESNGISSLDPAFASNFENISAINQIFNGLVQLDEKLDVKPCIAKSWEISENGKKYTFNLRKDVFFHESAHMKKSKRVTSNDFVYSFNRILDPEIASPGIWIFRDVAKNDKGEYAFLAPNDSTFIIELNHPFPPFLSILSMQYCSVVPKEVVENFGKDFRSNPIGTGPFYFKFWKEGEKLILLKNENYFELDSNNNKLPYLDAINIYFIKDRFTEFLEFTGGKFDMMPSLDASYKDEIITQKGDIKSQYSNNITLLVSPFIKTDYLGFMLDGNFNTPFSKNKKVRKAIAFAINRDEMVMFLRNNMGYSAKTGIVPKGVQSFREDIDLPLVYNIQMAKKLLEEAGFPNGKGLPTIKLSITPSYLDLCEFIQFQLKQIGINVDLEVLPPAIHNQKSAKGELAFFRKSWMGDYADAENFLSLFYSGNFCPKGPNYTHFKNEKFDNLYEKAKITIDDSLRFQLYYEMEDILLEEMPVIPIYYDKAVKFTQKRINGLKMNSLNLLNLKTVRKN